ncbi:MAG: hypothetical protein H0X64_00600 [Gemmatimonadaceae bacterium]|nr:hypothetical protein [Gemmatimonadaceae bacterium]
MADDRTDPIPFEKPRGKGAERDKQKGAQQHAQGMHGPKSRAHLIEQLESGGRGDEARMDGAANSHDDAGKHRLFEQREQRDDAERNSEKNRLDQDIQDHGHNRENFQVRGGSASSRAERRNPINPGEPDAPTPGLKMPPPPDRVP